MSAVGSGQYQKKQIGIKLLLVLCFSIILAELSKPSILTKHACKDFLSP